MVTNLSLHNSILSEWVRQIRDVEVQADRMRFRRNMERIGEIAAYEISKTLPYKLISVQTPMGQSECFELEHQPVLATILRAGVPLHQGLLNYFDQADNAFVAAYRKHHRDGSFEIDQQYLTCPELEGRPLIIADPMLATGASLVLTLENLTDGCKPSVIHFVSAIACTEGIDLVTRKFPDVHIWTAAIDDELTARGYIVPGLGDAGDLAYGVKKQS
ncbi:MAG: uracil phosphoribosyltransferase [Flavipsychrobacter sp.]|jgi:uracil phosphoribosyltransferase